jgi:molecular chaperone HtpG
LLAPNRAAAESSPYFEVFRERKFEVLFFYDAWDEFVIEHLHEFEGKPLRLAEKADLNLSAKTDGALSEDAAKALAVWLDGTGDSRWAKLAASLAARRSHPELAALQFQPERGGSPRHFQGERGHQSPSGRLDP